MKIQIIRPAENAVLDLCTPEQRRFLADEAGRAAVSGELIYKWDDLDLSGPNEYSLPAEIEVSFRLVHEKGDTLEGETAGTPQALILVSEYPEMKDCLVFPTKGHSGKLFNLKIGTAYYLCVQYDRFRSAVRRFSTLDAAPRCLRIDGLTNVRDFGGHPVTDGRVRQGMVYRGCETERHVFLQYSGLQQMKALGIRTEFDMRGEATDVAHSLLELTGARRIFSPAWPYREMVTAKQFYPSIRRFFRILSQPGSYPIYFHCWGGADRTGSYAYLLGAFLGMNRKTLVDEYEFTTLSVCGIRTRNAVDFAGMEQLLQAYPGETLSQKATAFLLDAGVSLSCLESVRRLLILSSDDA